MKRILAATKDCYITNRIIRNKFRATDANVGQAGTLDLFKLAGESTIAYITASMSGSNIIAGNGPFISGTVDPIELSRILIKFDLNPLRELTSSILSLSNPVISSSFSCILKLSDVMGGQPLPSNFSLILHPLSRSFDEGQGRDVYAFEDIDACNFITASISSGLAVTWSQTPALNDIAAGSGSTTFVGGAGHVGYVGEANVDAVSGSTILGDMFVVQAFTDPSADLSMDVTRIVSATLAGLIPDCGYRIAFSGTQETDSKTRFVKRFATRHSTNTRIRPKIIVGFNDSIQDHHENFYFDVSGSLFLNNYVRGQLTNISGSNPLLVTLITGSAASGTLYSASFSAAVHTQGIYSATFAIASNATSSLYNEIQNAHSATFIEIWSSPDRSIAYHSGSIVIYAFDRSTFTNVFDRIKLNITNMRGSFGRDEKIRFRVFVQDDGVKLKFSKLPFESKSLIFDDMHFRVRDVNSNEVIFDFDLAKDSTRLSTDSSGMFFDLFMSDLDVGRVYGIDLLIDYHGSKQIFENIGGSFRIDA